VNIVEGIDTYEKLFTILKNKLHKGVAIFFMGAGSIDIKAREFAML